MPDTGWLIAGALLAVPLVWAVANQHGVNRRRAHPTADERGYGWPPSGTTHSQWDSRSPGVHVNRWTPDEPAEQQEEW